MTDDTEQKRLLFFDIECCDGSNICEFGYVITDAQFNIVESDLFLMNPRARFTLYGRKARADLTLHYTHKEYYRSPPFTKFYRRIKEIVTAKNQTVIGFSMGSDAKFLQNACARYGLSHIDFDFVDIQTVVEELFDLTNQISLEDAAQKSGVEVEKPDLHRSDIDAEFTMRITRALCEQSGVSFDEFISRFPTAHAKSKGGEVLYNDGLKVLLEIAATSPDTMSARNRRKAEKEYASAAAMFRRTKRCALSGKAFCMSEHFLYQNVQDVLKIIELAGRSGALYERRVRACDYFVRHELDDLAATDTRFFRASAAFEQNAAPKIITYAELMELLGAKA